MPKFFVPSSWEDRAEVIKFRPKHFGSAVDNKTKGKKEKVHTDSAPSSSSDKPTSKPVPLIKESKINKTKDGKISKKKKKNKKLLDAKVSKAMEKAKKSCADIKTASHTSVLERLGNAKNNNTEKDGDLKGFEASLKEQLLGGRFRFINEQLYKMNSKQAEEFFKSDSAAFDAYHAGYRQQVENWPQNPLDRIIRSLRRLPKTLEIADFGCGEGRLAASVPNKVYSMDLVSTRDDIIACDMANSPLTNESVDIVVYCLSLMGTNLKDCILEANRVLRLHGLVFIAEIQSRFDDMRQFLKRLEMCGFELVKKEKNEGLFFFFELKKVRNVGKVAAIPDFALKPCLYRKR